MEKRGFPTFTTRSKVINGSMAFLSMPMMHWPSSSRTIRLRPRNGQRKWTPEGSGEERLQDKVEDGDDDVHRCALS